VAADWEARSSLTSAVSEVISFRRNAISSGMADDGGEARNSLTSAASEAISSRKEAIPSRKVPRMVGSVPDDEGYRWRSITPRSSRRKVIPT